MEEQKESTENQETGNVPASDADGKGDGVEKKSFLDKVKDTVGLGNGDEKEDEETANEEAEKPKEELKNKEPVSTMESPKPEAVIENIDELMDALSQLGVVNHMGHVNILKTMKANLKYQYKI